MKEIKRNYDENKTEHTYCINCKHFMSAIWDDVYNRKVSPYCRAKTGKIIIDYVYGDYPERILKEPDDKDYPNKKGNCLYYFNKMV